MLKSHLSFKKSLSLTLFLKSLPNLSDFHTQLKKIILNFSSSPSAPFHQSVHVVIFADQIALPIKPSPPSFETARVSALLTSCTEHSPSPVPLSPVLPNRICPQVAIECSSQSKLIMTVSNAKKPLLTPHDLQYVTQIP